MPERLLVLVSVWSMLDKAKGGRTHVVHDVKGKPLERNPYELFARIREAAGLPDTVTMRTLRASCAVWLMEAGCTPEEAADFLGNTDSVLSKFYDVYGSEHSHAAADALDSRSYARNDKS